MTTPDFPVWQGQFSRQVRHLRSSLGSSLHQFECLFGPWIAHWRLAQQDEGAHSRTRRWPLRLVFWTFLWQVAQAGTGCCEAIRQAQALCLNRGRPKPPDKKSPYCQARARLPLERLQEIHEAVVEEAQKAIARRDLWCGHSVLVVDGTTVTAPDTPANQEAYPQQKVQKPGCGFPILRLVALLSLATGMLVGWTTGTFVQSELTLWQRLWEHLRPGQVLLGDRGFGCWGLLAQCLQRQVHAVFRVRGARRQDFRRGQRLSRDERLVRWTKPSKRPETIGPEEWALLPAVLSLRLVRCQLAQPGFRTRQVILVTTLLDSQRYSPAALGQLYYRRWRMELTLRNLKTTLQMDHLSCLTPGNLDREIRMHFLVHNLVRRLMLESARRYHVPLEEVSFGGALAVVRRYSEALLQARSERQRRALREEMLRVLAEDLVPQRPGRREPRGVKRRPKPYPLLTCHRSKFREIRHQSRYRRKSKKIQGRKSKGLN